MEDIKIICKDCGEEFIFSIRDQEFFKQQGFNSQPVRCKSCRQKKKAAMNNKVKKENN
ncbi:MAG: zinc-ribbon domain-containing protein [Clostridia bacterium]|nr:zinc-ribbon domain-containing protein [Clostridia bacterium]